MDIFFEWIGMLLALGVMFFVAAVELGMFLFAAKAFLSWIS